MSFTASLEMTPQFYAKIAALKQALGAGVDQVVLAAAQPVVNKAQERAPYLTGTLKRSIHAEMHGEFAMVGSSEPYAARLEFGFVGADSLGRHYNQAPRPYLRPAIDETQAEVRAAAEQGLRALIRSLG